MVIPGRTRSPAWCWERWKTIRLMPVVKAQSPRAFIEAGWACQASRSSEVNDSAATMVRPFVCAIPAASTTLWAVLKP